MQNAVNMSHWRRGLPAESATKKSNKLFLRQQVCGIDCEEFYIGYSIIEVWTSGPVSRFSMAAFTSSCAKKIGKPGLGRSDTSRSLCNYGCMLVQKIGKILSIQINKVTKRLRWIGNQACLLEIIQECSVVNRMEMTEGMSLWWWQWIWRDAEMWKTG